MKFSIIVPAFNEEAYVAATLDSIRSAAARLRARSEADTDVIVPPKLFDEIHAAMNDPDCVGGAVDVEYRPRRFSMRLYLRIWRVLARLTGMAQRGDAVLSTVRLRADRRLRRGGLDRRGCRFLLEPQEVSQEEESHGPVHTEHACAAVVPSLRQVADLENPYLDKPALYRVVPPT